MISRLLTLVALTLIFSCKTEKESTVKEVIWQPYNDSIDVAGNSDHEIKRMRYKLIQSKVLNKNEIFLPLYNEVSKVTEADYQKWKPFILEQDILSIQFHIADGDLTYEELTLFYLYRIYKYELNNETTLNTILALNSNVLEEARAADKEFKKSPSKERNPIFGMPILLKDNIDTDGMSTTAGAIALMNNSTNDAFIVERLKENGALILGKVNLSEWAYFLCSDCPVGYSAVGGQTLNPYGRMIFETGGSSAGSGTSVAANYAVAAVGTETSGSILSPSSQNSVVGLKPTIGLLSRSGIVPISSTLDTPGPMTKNVVDNAILLTAMTGHDVTDSKSVSTSKNYLQDTFKGNTLQGKRFGVFKNLMESDSIYAETITKIKSLGGIIIEFTPDQVGLPGFLSILNIDMKNDLPAYIKANVKNKEVVKIGSIADVIEFNNQDSLIRIPYGQALFKGIIADTTSLEELEVIVSDLENIGRSYFDKAMDANHLDAILSINNYHAGYAAVAKYPALTVPMGYKKSGEPLSLTFIAKQFQEAALLQLGLAFEKATKVRKMPQSYH
ncbi:amidase family protein [Cellulophaga tyrosinoxydans]|uniref:Amidase n=1 Tax=Cellulophaga tyrosinoxydans TaxID=504486 RepID=A0A1W2C2G3_9FLAO|nr:amidase family protein [Cellulophaga tyrosinoxydans]SMC78898.1 amidase [Cellulophaga tyrosinoxydans]